jgi:DNA-binding transcriptional LysR family regulator
MFGDPWVASGHLVPILEKHWPTVPIFAVHAGPNPPPPKVRAFIALVRDAKRALS